MINISLFVKRESISPVNLSFVLSSCSRMNHIDKQITLIFSLIIPLRTGELHLAIYQHPLQDLKQIRIEGTVDRKRSPPNEKWIFLNSRMLLSKSVLLPQVIFRCITHKFFYTLRKKGAALIEI